MPRFSELAAMKPRLLRHIGFWAAYLLLMGYLSGRYDFRFGVAYFSEFLQLPAKMGAAYLIFYWLETRPGESVVRLGLRILAVFCIAVFANRLLMYWYLHPTFYADQYGMIFWHFDRILFAFIDVATPVAAATAIKMSRFRQASRLREQQLIQEKLQSELKFLRAQTNPHFLFNTLNSTYALARKEAPRTAEALMRLSKLLRFILYDCAKPQIPLSDEAKVIRDLIELEKLRYGDRLRVTYEEQIDDPSQPIAPLLLLPFVENAFKHGASETRFASGIAIRLHLENGRLHFEVRNDKEPDEAGAETEGLGLRNVQRQLELLYPGAYELKIDAGQREFCVNLLILVDRG